MEKFDVSYRLRDDENRSLVAQLVPHQRPSLPWDRDRPAAAGNRTLALICEISEPAPGLVAWLTVRHHRASTGKHWRRGVFLRHPIEAYSSEALFDLLDERHLSIEVRAPSPDLFFNVLRDSVEDLITQRWPGLTYQLFIPCPTRGDDHSVCPGQFKLTSLRSLRERNERTVVCMECLERHEITKLLTGFDIPMDPFQPELERLHERLSEVAGGVDVLQRYAADTAESIRRVLKATSIEVSDCPRFFTLTPLVASGLRRLAFHEVHYRLILWCEHPGEWHDWPKATYDLHQPKKWLTQVAPYANLVFKTLRLIGPIAGSVAGVTLSEEQLKRAQDELDLMNTLIDKLPESVRDEQRDFSSRKLVGNLSRAEGEGLRALRTVLLAHDRSRRFGGLRRVLAPSGDYYWVCSMHYPEYDPGLPTIPDAR